jgi:predicted TIM-barrel fold metal-dependent hydrolase
MLLRTSDKTIEEQDDGGTPIPNQIVSNGEYWPLPQTPKQKRTEELIHRMADERARKLGVSRRDFLRTAAGTATALMALNIVNGCGGDDDGSGGFAVDDCATRDPEAARELFQSDFFILDVQTHHVDLDGAAATNPGLKEFFASFRFCSPSTVEDGSCHPGVIDELSRANFLKELFLDSETAVAMMSGIPAPSRSLQALSNEAMAGTRDIANELGASQRCLTQGMVTPNFGPENDSGTLISDMEFMVKELGIRALKTYTGAGGGIFGAQNAPWWLDDENVSYPMLEEATRLGINIVNTHKGLRLGIFDPEYIKPRDVPNVVRDWPTINFVIYHSAGEFLDDLVAIKRFRVPDVTNLYSELGSIFAQAVLTGVDQVGHLLGKLVTSFGSDHVIWGTDAIWWGSPQWQIDALKTFKMPERLMEEFGYPEITDEIKAQIFGLNAARLYGVDVDAVRCTLPPDFEVPAPTAAPPSFTATATPRGTSTPTPVGVPTGTVSATATPGVPGGSSSATIDRIALAKQAYKDVARPSLRTYGPKTRRDFIKLNFSGGNPLG